MKRYMHWVIFFYVSVCVNRQLYKTWTKPPYCCESWVTENRKAPILGKDQSGAKNEPENTHITKSPKPLFLLSPGPALSGTLVQKFGFKWMLYGIAIINFLYAPLMYCLKSPPAKNPGERQVRRLERQP